MNCWAIDSQLIAETAAHVFLLPSAACCTIRGRGEGRRKRGSPRCATCNYHPCIPYLRLRLNLKLTRRKPHSARCRGRQWREVASARAAWHISGFLLQPVWTRGGDNRGGVVSVSLQAEEEPLTHAHVDILHPQAIIRTQEVSFALK